MVNNYPLIFRLTVISYYNLKKSPIKELLIIFNISKSSLYNWLKDYRLGKLSEKKRYKKRSKFTSEIKIYIKKYVLSRKIFNYKRLINLIKKKFNTNISKSSLYNVLKNLEITYKRVKRKMIYGAKNKLMERKKEFQKTIKKVNFSDIIYIDETSIDTRMMPIYGWSNKGNKLTHEVNANKKRYTIICAINNKKVIYYEIVKNSVDKIIFRKFIEKLFNIGINNKKIVLDNACIHHSKIVKEYVDKSTNEFIYNAPYTPEYNPIENLFSKLKANIRKSLNNNYNKLNKIIKSTFKSITNSELENYYRHSFTF